MTMKEASFSSSELLKILQNSDNDGKEKIKNWLAKLTNNELLKPTSQKHVDSSKTLSDLEDKKLKLAPATTMEEIQEILSIFGETNKLLRNKPSNVKEGKDEDGKVPREGETKTSKKKPICCIVGRLLKMKLVDEAKALLDHCVLSDEKGKYFKIDHQFLLDQNNEPCRPTLLKKIFSADGSDDHPLQTHPVVLYLLKSRWDASCYFTLSTVTIQLTFVLHLMNYAMGVQSGCGNASNCFVTQQICKSKTTNCSNHNCTLLSRDESYYQPQEISIPFLLVSVVLLFLREIVQFIYEFRISPKCSHDEESKVKSQPSCCDRAQQCMFRIRNSRFLGAIKSYFVDLENLFQLYVIVTTCVFIIMPSLLSNVRYSQKLTNSATESCSGKADTTCDSWTNTKVEPIAVTVLIAILLLVVQLRKLGSGGDFVFMVKKISRSYLNHATFIFVSISGFALAFQMVYQSESDQSLRSFPGSFIKSLVMFTGEYDYEEHIGKQAEGGFDYENPHYVTGGLTFTVFLIVMVIIVQNLLTGVATEDVRTVHLDAVKERLRFLFETDSENWYLFYFFAKAEQNTEKTRKKDTSCQCISICCNANAVGSDKTPAEGMAQPNYYVDESKNGKTSAAANDTSESECSIEKHAPEMINPASSRMEQPNYYVDESNLLWDLSYYTTFIGYPIATAVLIWAKNACYIEYLTEHYEKRTVTTTTIYNILDYGLLLAYPILIIIYPLIHPYLRLCGKVLTPPSEGKDMHFPNQETLDKLKVMILINLDASIINKKISEITKNDLNKMQREMEKRMEDMRNDIEMKMKQFCQDVGNSVQSAVKKELEQVFGTTQTHESTS